jgi:hypothetical protein
MTIKAFALRLCALMLPALLVGALFGSMLYNTARAAADTPVALAIDAGAAPAAAAAPAVAPVELPDGPGPVVEGALEAAQGGEWRAAALLLLAAIVLGVRLVWKAANTRIGGWVANFAVSALMLFAAAAKAGEPFSLSLLASVVTLSLSAAGGVTLYQDVKGGLKKQAA